MAIDDDDFENYRLGDADRPQRNDSWDLPDDSDRIPDEMATIRCHHCRKWILEDTPQCPYCKHSPLERRNKKSVWFTAAVILLLAVIFILWVILRTTSPADPLFTQ